MLSFAKKLTLVVLFAQIAGAAHAAASVRAEGSTLVINEVPVLRLRSSSGGLDPAARAQNLAAALIGMSSHGSILSKQGGGGHQIWVSGKAVLTVTPREAALNKSTTASLAAAWATRMRQAFYLPGLKLGDAMLRLPVGGSRAVSLLGSLVQEAAVESGDEDVAKVSRKGGVLTVTGVGAGQTSVIVSAGGLVQALRVEVRPYAATFPQSLSAAVTGVPSTIVTVRGAIEGAIRTGFATAPGATYSIGPIKASQIGVGEAKTFAVRIKATGPSAIPSEGIVNVVVRNLQIPHKRESELWYCNDPENVYRPGPLFHASLDREEAARLLYHHVNASPSTLYIKVQAVNATSAPAKLLIIPGDSKPDKNPVLAGIQAADQFVRNWVRASGEVITLPPGSSMPISIRRLYSSQTMSGLCYLRLVEGEALTIRADAGVPYGLDDRWLAALSSSTPWRETGTRKLSEYDSEPGPVTEHIYPNPFKEEELSYEVGGRYGFVRIGQKPIPRKGEGRGLDGNFGVVYNIAATIANPTDLPTEIELVFEASAGYSGALFVVNGQYQRTPLLQPKGEYQVAKFMLAPSASRRLTIMTVPLSGSSYPATLTIRPVRDSYMAGIGGRS